MYVSSPHSFLIVSDFRKKRPSVSINKGSSLSNTANKMLHISMYLLITINKR